jgi:predicted phosphodiesterase
MKRTKWASKSKETAKVVLTLLTACVLALFFMSSWGKILFPVKAFDFLISLQPSWHGVTEVKIPPVGTISAATHHTPVKIKIILENININILHDLISQKNKTTADESGDIKQPVDPNQLVDTQNLMDSTQLVSTIKNEIKKNAYRYVLRLILLALCAGVLASLIINGKKIKPLLGGAAIALLLALFLIGLTYHTYDPQKFRNPEFRGALEAAPWMIRMAENVLQKYDALGDQLEIIANNLTQLYEGINVQETLFNAEEGQEIAVLLVSDIHNNVAAKKFIRQIAENFSIDLFIDTGDLTDYGTKLESLLTNGLNEIERPYLFIPGNHDSPEIILSLSAYPQVTIANNQLVELSGLNIFAIADPLSASKEMENSSEEQRQEFRQQILNLWKEVAAPPDLIAAHNLQDVSPLIGQVPLIVHGHTHRLSVTEEKGTLIINAGSTGGAGIRGLQAHQEIPYSVILLHFRKNSNEHNNDDGTKNEAVSSEESQRAYRVYAADIIKVYNLDKSFSLERKYFK